MPGEAARGGACKIGGARPRVGGPGRGRRSRSRPRAARPHWCFAARFIKDSERTACGRAGGMALNEAVNYAASTSCRPNQCRVYILGAVSRLSHVATERLAKPWSTVKYYRQLATSSRPHGPAAFKATRQRPAAAGGVPGPGGLAHFFYSARGFIGGPIGIEGRRWRPGGRPSYAAAKMNHQKVAPILSGPGARRRKRRMYAQRLPPAIDPMTLPSAES